MEINHKLLKFVVFAIVAMLAACGSDTYYSGHYENIDDKFGKQPIATDTSAKENFNKSIAFEGKFNLVSVLEPVKLEITALDENFEKTQTVSARIERNRLDFTYKAPEIHFYRPYAQIDFTCRFRDTKDPTEMQFTILANLKENGFQNIDFYRTIESGYLKKLLKKNESYSFAKWHTRQAIHNLLDPELEYEYGIENAPYGADTLEALAYNYSLFFTWDSTFYKNFKKLSQAVGGSKKWDEILPVSEISEKLTEHYKFEDSRCNKDSLEKVKQDRDFTQLRYIMAIWVVQGNDSIDCNTEKIIHDYEKQLKKDSTEQDTVQNNAVIEKFGKCTLNRARQKVKLEAGKYYECDSLEWKPIFATTYYGDQGESGEIVLYDGTYFVCTGGDSWEVIKEDEITPPVKDLRKCTNQQILKYGEKYYRCYSTAWKELATQDSISKYQRNGKFCTDSTNGIFEEVKDTIYQCSEYAWLKADDYNKALYQHALAHKDECKNGAKGTKIYWSESMQYYFFCNNDSKKWDYTRFSDREHYEPGMFDKGTFVNDTTIEVTNGVFSFTIVQITTWDRRFDVDHITAKINAHTYGALFRNIQPYLSGLRGNDSLAIKNVTDKSESFDGFMAQYTHTESMYPAYIALFMHVGEESYMAYSKAKSFCPAGYHIPDTSGWKADFLKSYPLDARENQDSPLNVLYNGTTYLYDIYWTSSTKDSETQYCYEIHYENNKGPFSKIIECPKDLYPGVQTLCFKDGEEND